MKWRGLKHITTSVALYLLAQNAYADLFDKQLTDERAASIRRMAVISTLGATLHGRNVDVTVFGNQAFEADVPSWALDSLIEQQLLDGARSDSRLKDVGILTLDSAARALLYDGSGVNLRFHKPALLKAAADQGFDAVLVFAQGYNENEPFAEAPLTLMARPEFWGALKGWKKSSTSPYKIMPCATAVFRVLSAATGKQIAFSRGGENCGIPEPSLTWHKTWGEYTQDEQAATEAAFKAFLVRRAQAALSNMHFGVPADGSKR